MNIRLNKTFSEKELIEAFESVKNIKSVPGGYPGEGNINWNSITIYSLGNEKGHLLSMLPTLEKEITSLKLNLRLVRFMMLGPGGIIKPHQDVFLSKRIVRLHIPVITHSNVEFYLNEERCDWKAGEMWYGDFSKRHSVINNSNITRVHLVMDVSVDENFLQLFPSALSKELFSFVSKDSENEFINPQMLERFSCNFLLPPGFNIPGLNFLDLKETLHGSVRLANGELCVLVNEQPLLKALPLTEDKLSLVGLEHQAYVDYVFNNDSSIKSLSLNVANINLPISFIKN